MFKRVGILITVVALFLMLIVSNCGGPRGEIKIGAILPLSGNLQSYGLLIKNGMDLAVEEINQGDGVDGSDLKIVYKDSEGKPEVATKVYAELVTQEKVPMIIGGVSSTVSLALAPLADKDQVVLVSPASSNPKLSGISDWFFRTYPSDTLEGYTMANRIINYQTYRGQTFFADCVVIAAKTDYAEGVKIEFVKEFRRRKGNTKAVINFDSYNPDFPSIAKEVVKIAKGDALAVFIAGYYQDIANFLLALKKQRGFDPQAVKIFACHAANTPEFKRIAAEYFIPDGPNKYGLVFPVIAYITPDSPDEEIASFARRFYNRFGNYPENFAAHSYDTVKLVADVMDKRGVLPRDIQFGMSIVKNWPGVAGKITFDDAHDVSKYPVIYGYDGKHMYIFEPDYKEKAEGYYKVEVWR